MKTVIESINRNRIPRQPTQKWTVKKKHERCIKGCGARLGPTILQNRARLRFGISQTKLKERDYHLIKCYETDFNCLHTIDAILSLSPWDSQVSTVSKMTSALKCMLPAKKRARQATCLSRGRNPAQDTTKARKLGFGFLLRYQRKKDIEDELYMCTQNWSTL